LRDFRYSARSLLRTPGFTLVAVVVLGLGIGATTAIFSLVSAVWLKPLPFADEERLVSLWVDLSAQGGPARLEATPAHFSDWRERAQSFEQMVPIAPQSINLTGSGEPERLSAVRTTPDLFATIGLAPVIGRTFEPGDAAEEAVVVSEGFWLRRLGGDPDVVGRTIMLDRAPHVVIGVVPSAFRFPYSEKDVFIATDFPPELLADRGAFIWNVIAKLRPGVSVAAAQAEMISVAAALLEEKNRSGTPAAVVPLRETLAAGVGVIGRDIGPTLVVLLAAVGLVLLIACANVANLMLARATMRQKEFAIRKALGAAQGRVLRQLLTESAVLAAASVVVGLALAAACFGYLTRLLPATLPASANVALDPRALALTIGTAFVTVLLFGAGPAVAAARRDFGAAFTRAVGAAGTKARRLRTTLVVAEIALTVVLLAGAGLLLRSYAAVLAVDPGFDAENVLLVDTPLTAARYPNGADRDAFYRRVLDRVRELPGVESVGYTNIAPLVIKGGRSITLVEGRPRPDEAGMLRTIASDRGVSAGYFETLGVPLMRGRYIDERDTRDATLVAVINEAMVRAHWPDEDPLGRRFEFGLGGTGRLFTVVGVVGDVRQSGLDVPAFPEVYAPLDQLAIQFMWPTQLVVRTAGDPIALGPAVRRAIWSIDADQPVANVRTMRDVVDVELAGRSTQLTLLGAFAAIALVLAAVGLYGTLSYTVSQSTSEIGLRMALGAERRTVVGSVVRTALGAALLGIGLGLAVAFGLTRTISSFLYGVSPTDPATALAVAGVLLAVTVLAALVPARRAAGVDPMTALRADG
jgi:putative ABC transport system permease protein